MKGICGCRQIQMNKQIQKNKIMKKEHFTTMCLPPDLLVNTRSNAEEEYKKTICRYQVFMSGKRFQESFLQR